MILWIFLSYCTYQIIGYACFAWFDKNGELLQWVNDAKKVSLGASAIAGLATTIFWPITLIIFLRKGKP